MDSPIRGELYYSSRQMEESIFRFKFARKELNQLSKPIFFLTKKLLEKIFSNSLL